MPRYFLDSSALVKRYHQESGTPLVEGLFNQPNNQLLITRLAITEVHSCFARLVRDGVLTQPDFQALIARLTADVASGALVVAAVSGPRLNDASTLLGSHGLTNPLRTLDAIHLATALAIHSRRRLAAFVVADKRLLASASICGLLTLDVS